MSPFKFSSAAKRSIAALCLSFPACQKPRSETRHVESSLILSPNCCRLRSSALKVFIDGWLMIEAVSNSSVYVCQAQYRILLHNLLGSQPFVERLEYCIERDSCPAHADHTLAIGGERWQFSDD
jgi:hypothetical protein